ncbi:hypothetical protein Tco_0666237 [Tanacetum coccineum]
MGLWYPRESPLDLEAFSDSDYGGSNLDRKSTTGGCQFLGQRLISWQCKKQTIVATSTTEAEYVAAANCCGQVLWVQNQLLDYGFNFMNTKIHIDNESTICIVKNPRFAEIVDFLRGSNLRAIARLKRRSLEISATIDTIRGFQGAPRPLLPSMLLVATNPIAGQEHAAQAQSQPSPTPPPIPTSTSPPPPIPSPTPPPIPTPTSPPPPPPETEPTTDEYLYEKHSPVHHHFSPSQEQAPSRMPMDDLLHTVPKLISRIDSLELDLKQTKLTMGNAIVKLVKKVKKSIDKGRRYKRRKETKGKKVVSSLDFQQDDAGAEKINTAGEINAASIEVNNYGQEKLILEVVSLSSTKMHKEEELTEQQKKRKAQVQFEAQHYTNEDWDLIRAKLEANAELSKSMLGSELQGEDFAKKMVDLVNQRKKFFAEERAKAKRNKPMTQSQLKTYMMNYLKNQGSWKLNQLRKLSFDEVKREFDKLVRQVESFAPISFEATKDSLKRFGEELQTKTPKRLKEEKGDEAKDDESTKKSGKRRKQMARKGMNTNVDENDSEESDKVDEQEETNTGTETPINPVPVAMKTPSVATYKIIKQGEKGVYQIVREDGTDIVYINFGAMMKSISRDDLTELYRIVMSRYGMDGPEDKLEKGFWKCLRIMFEEPLSTDSIWSKIGQQKIISWRYYDTCKTMLKMKLLDGKMSEDCYRLLKMMEKQAGIRK